MIWLAVVLGLAGLLLSALFSGSETGFYRANPLRLMLDARSGRPLAGLLHWLYNHAAVFVATTLVGNNVANYLVSLAVVLLVDSLWGSKTAELLAPVVLAPILFVLGELLPKRMFYQAPNRLLYRCAPAFTLFAVLFAPVSVVLWAFGRLLERLSGESHPHLQQVLARRGLHAILAEGDEVGVLRPAQRQMAQGLLAVAVERVARFALPPWRLPRVYQDQSPAEVLRLARRHRAFALPVEDRRERKLVGYVVVAEVALNPDEKLAPVRPLPRIDHNEPHISALVRMYSQGHLMAEVVGSQGRTVGLLTTRVLFEPLLRGES